MPNPDAQKITAFIVAGNISGREKEDLTAIYTAIHNLPSNAVTISQAQTPLFDTFSLSPISRDKFMQHTPELLRRHGEGGLIFFMQFGHGSTGPSISFGSGGGIAGNEFTRLFADNVDRKVPPYVAIIMGTCYSGGFGKLFLNSSFIPDFFYGSSPAFSVNHIGLGLFFDVPRNLADKNEGGGDGVVTLREMALYQLNNSPSPLGIMLQKYHSPDIDMHGRRAIKPYFAKAVQRVASHQKLIETIAGLRFGEQAVVMLEGNGKDSEGLKTDFEKQAAEGDGYYKFLIIADNPESRKYFGMSNDSSPAIFAMGPNLRRRGVKLNASRAIGQQVPEVLANENPLLVMRDWEDKIRRNLRNQNVEKFAIYEFVLDHMKSNPDFTVNDLLNESVALVANANPDKQIQGLQFMLVIQEANGIDHSALFPHLHKIAEPIISGKKNVNISILSLLIQNLNLIASAESKKDLSELFLFCITRFPNTAKELIQKGIGVYDLLNHYKERIDSQDTSEQVEAISALALVSNNTDREIAGRILSFSTDSKNQDVRRASAFFVSSYGGAWSSTDIKTIAKAFLSEKDNQIRGFFLNVLAGKEAMELADVQALEPAVQALMYEKTAPAETKAAAQKFLKELQHHKDELQKQKDAEKKIKEKEEKRIGQLLKWRFEGLGGFGPMGMIRKEESEIGGTGGLAAYGRAHLIKGMRINDHNLVSVGIGPTVEVDLHWKKGWFDLMPGASLSLEWRRTEKELKEQANDPDNKNKEYSYSAYALEGGYIGRYTPIEDSKKYSNGIFVGLGFRVFADEQHRSSSDKGSGGLSIRGSYFPQDKAFFFSIGNSFSKWF
ncbi:MAG: hypothetical protein WC600_17695 [Desulfobaccales bacterium]